MARQSALLWTGLAGFLFCLIGLALNFSDQTGYVHLKLGSWENASRHASQGTTAYSLRLDSLQVSPITPTYELQVRQAAGEFNQQMHPGLPRPSSLVNAYALEPMEIRKIGETPYRFRLKEFYPDFTFQYSYPQHQDTIAPKAPGITLTLMTPAGEEVVTLRSDQPKLSKLDDVVQLGCTLQFFWNYTGDSTSMTNTDTTITASNTIIFSGEDKIIYFHFDGKTSSVPLEINRFYPIPGKDTIGFTVLQCFPDIAFLTAHPSSKSKEMNNPVAGVEVWKLDGLSQEVYLYPTSSATSGGQWEVPGSDLLVGLGLSHKEIANNCQCYLSLADSSRQINKQVIFQGKQTLSYAGNRITLIECDTKGFWATLQMRRATGYWLIMAGGMVAIGALLLYLIGRKRSEKGANFHQTIS